jgi:hypothetical protein
MQVTGWQTGSSGVFMVGGHVRINSSPDDIGIWEIQVMVYVAFAPLDLLEAYRNILLKLANKSSLRFPPVPFEMRLGVAASS